MVRLLVFGVGSLIFVIGFLPVGFQVFQSIGDRQQGTSIFFLVVMDEDGSPISGVVVA